MSTEVWQPIDVAAILAPISDEQKRRRTYQIGEVLSYKTGSIYNKGNSPFGEFKADEEGAMQQGDTVEIHLFGHVPKEVMDDEHGKSVAFVYGSKGLVPPTEEFIGGKTILMGRETIIRKANIRPGNNYNPEQNPFHAMSLRDRLRVVGPIDVPDNVVFINPQIKHRQADYGVAAGGLGD